MYCNPRMVRGLVRLLRSNIISDGIKSKKEEDLLFSIINSDAKLDDKLSVRYKTEIEPKEYNVGLISTVKVPDPDTNIIESPYNVISGINTLFLDSIFFGDVIFIKKTKEALQVKQVVSDTSIIVSSNSNFTAIDSEFFVIPSKISYCSSFLAIKHILMLEYPDTTYSQEAIPFFTQFEKDVKPTLDAMEKGEAYFDNLVISSSKNAYRKNVRLTNNIKRSNDCFIQKISNYP